MTAGPPTCPPGRFSPPDCLCYEEDTAYFGNNHVTGHENPTSSRSECQRSCAKTPECQFWTWGVGEPTGPCYLKTARENVRRNLTSYVSGTKDCRLPEDKGLDCSVD